MRKMVITLLALGVFAASSAFAANAVRFSQVYGGGGSGTGTYAPDYVELFNNGCVPVDMSGWQLQYGSATGNFASNTFTIATLPAGAVIQPCGYYLVQVGSSATGPPPLPVTPDFVNTPGPNMSATAGKVALLPAGTATNQTCAVIAPLAIDLFGWGTTATCFEGALAPAPSNVIIAVRNGGGTIDTDNNFNDFTNVSAPLVTMHSAAGGYRNPVCVVACQPTTGACCLRNADPGAVCVVVTAADCQTRGGIFLGLGIPCDAGQCAVPTTKTTWGQLKTIYR